MGTSRRKFQVWTSVGARALRGMLLAGAIGCIAGCMHPGAYDSSRTGPLFKPSNFSGESNLGGIRRVVLLPVWGGRTASSESANDLDPAVAAALLATQRFEVVSLSREECLRRFQADSFSSAGALPHTLMAILQRDYAADAVMLVDLTVYRPYRPLALGLRAKLATVAETRLVWTFDTVFSTEDPTVANAARNHFLAADRRAPADLTHGVLQSPARFAAYASNAMFATLPPVYVPPVGVGQKDQARTASVR